MELDTSLSFPARAVLWITVPLILAVLFLASRITAVLSAIVLAIPAALLWQCHYRAQSGQLDKLTWTFLGSGTIGLATVAAVQAVLCFVYAYILFREQYPAYFVEFRRTKVDDLTEEQQQHREGLARTWQYIMFIALFTFTAAGFLEETLKYVAVQLASRAPILQDEYFQCAVAAALGLSVIENIGFLYAARNEGLRMLSLTFLERVFLGMPTHTLTGCLVAAGMIRRDLQGETLSFWQIIIPPTLYHGMFDFILLAVSAAGGNVGWVHPRDIKTLALMLSLVFSVIVFAALHLWHDLGILNGMSTI